MKAWLAVAAAALLLLLPFAMLVGLLTGILGNPSLICGTAPGAAGGGPAVNPVANAGGLPSVAGYSGKQLADAALIMRAAADHGFGLDGQTLGVMVAMGESGITPVNHGDKAGPDSLGYFQQRDPWGPTAVRLDPYQSATMFFTGGQGGQKGLDDIPGWQSMTPTHAAHAVQRNADPEYYTKFHGPAQQVVAALGGGLPPNPNATPPPDCPTTPTQAGAPLPAGPGGWVRPAVGRLSSGFGNRGATAASSAQHHNGQDIANTCGTPIYAASAGAVISSGPASGFGNWIRIDHGNGLITVYGHMKAADLLVHVGDHVTAGQQISRIGSEGQSTGCHLHFGVAVNGSYVDPAPFLTARGAVL
jgi:murein DD-endopeptidase MepM/ murein hydrolase activator NlpD